MIRRDSFVVRRAFTVSWLLLSCCLASCAAVDSSIESVDADALLGSWTVDLRPTPGSAPYYKEFAVTSVQGNTFSGTFYGTEISQARINVDWGKLRIAFVTADGSGPYNHSAVLDDDTLEGLSNSTGSNFLSDWSAVKE